MRRRSVLNFAFGLMLLLYVYSITGLRSALLGLGFVVGFYVFAWIVKAAAFTWAWSAALTAFVSAAAMVSSIPVLSFGVDLVVRRVLTMGGMLNYNYIKIFGPDEPTYFSHTILGTFWQRTLRETPQDIVGEQLVGRAVGANGSFIADGYVSGKLLGVVFATVVVALYLALLDAITIELPPPVALASTSMVIFILTQTSVVTALISLGGVALAACLWLAGSALAVERSRSKSSRSTRSARFSDRRQLLTTPLGRENQQGRALAAGYENPKDRA
jgi:hypothetical protein